VTAYFGEGTYLDELLATSDNRPVGTPVGGQCYGCRTTIVQGDQGFIKVAKIMTAVGPADAVIVIHLECDFRAKVGSLAHREGRCACVTGIHDHSEQSPAEARAEALEVWRRRDEWREQFHKEYGG
jgi:hypothetical protein